MSVPHIKNVFLHFRFSLLHSPPAALPPPEGGERWRWENLPTQPLWESRVLRRARWSDRRANGKKRGETAEQKLERTEDERKVQLPAVCPGRLSSADCRTFRRWHHHNLQPWTQTPGQILTTASHTHTHTSVRQVFHGAEIHKSSTSWLLWKTLKIIQFQRQILLHNNIWTRLHQMFFNSASSSRH